MANRWGSNGNSERLFFFGGGAPKSLQMVTAAMKLKDACSLEKSYDEPRQHIENNIFIMFKILKFTNKGLSNQGYDFSSGHVWM